MKDQMFVRPPPARTVRKAHGMSIVRVAGLVGVGVTTARIYELDPEAVRAAERRKLNDFYAWLREDEQAA